MVFDVNEENAESFERIPFEDIVVLGSDLAFWNQRKHDIYCTINAKRGDRRSLWAISEAQSGDDGDAEGGREETFGGLGSILADIFSSGRRMPKDGSLILESDNSGVKATLYSPPITDPVLGHNTSAITLHLQDVDVKSGQEASRFLFDIAHAIFFELDLRFSVTLQIAERVGRYFSPLEMVRDDGQSEPLRLPDRRFARAAIALYMYARTINTYPLLEYLTLYQVIEHCMLAFSRPETIERLKARLQDPSFDINDHVGLSQLLSSERHGSRANLSERDQVRFTVQTCVPPEAITGFLQSNDETAQFISQEGRPLGASSVDPGDKRKELPTQIADRIYDMRCRIVHAKGDSLDKVGGPLLPTSQEANQLGHDLLIIRFIAQQVLIASAISTTW